MSRSYRMAKRAEAQEETRERIVRATMALHLEQGVATTSYTDVAERAGVGAATVYRHFPTMGSLVEACGAHVWRMIEPPRPEDAEARFIGLRSRTARIERLARELDAFYARGAVPLWGAEQDRERLPELDAFLRRVDEGVAALVAAALGGDVSEPTMRIARAVAHFTVWRALAQAEAEPQKRIRVMAAMIEAAVTRAAGE
ncbi:MAG TPA: helix-turn-helix domain-containing protein [Bauldia sp.]|nr:helix-turn-helix domain-containing protein [Bauldia sp.]